MEVARLLKEVLDIVVVALPAILAITLHEAAHGWMAWRCGDDTAKRLGRVTLNPFAHVDLAGTILVPLALYFTTGLAFGWAKPVPINFHGLNNPRHDTMKVAIAGPAANLLQALTATALLLFVPPTGGAGWYWLAIGLINAIAINVVLMLFNLIPIPPLDGSRVVAGLLPYRLAYQYGKLERMGLLIVLVLMVGVPWIGQQFGRTIEPLGWLFGPAINWSIDTALRLTGHA